jgi:hypothetical protein
MLGPVTTPPTDTPTAGPAVELPPAGEQWRPKVTVYQRPGPGMWIYWPDRWVYATVTARHDYASGLVAYQVELTMPNDDGTTSRVSRTFPWGKDNIRPADD